MLTQCESNRNQHRGPEIDRTIENDYLVYEIHGRKGRVNRYPDNHDQR